MLTVGIVSGDTASAGQLLTSLQQTGAVKSVKQWKVPGDRPPESAELLPDLVFLDLSRDPEPYFAFGAQLRKIRPGLKLVACSATDSPNHQLLLEAMRSGVQDFLPKPVSSRALKEMLSRFLQETNAKDHTSLDKLIVVMGSKGGVGATTVAVNLGVQLSTGARKRVALLDFARPLGNVHLLLDLQPKFSVRDAVENLERLDSLFLSGLLTKHKTQLEILGGATHPEEWQAIAVAPLERVVNVAQSSFEVVLVDMGSQFSSEWEPVLQAARMILVVAEANVPALWTLERRLLALKGFGISPDRARVVINRWHKADENVLKTIQKDMNHSIFACLPNDFRKASESVNLGMPLHENHNNVLTNRYRQMAGQLMGIDTHAAAKKGSFGGLFSFETKR